MRSRPIAVAVACGVLAFPAGASAHTGIDHTSPRAGSTVSRSISVVKVFFEGRVSDATLVVERDGSKVSNGDGALADRGRQVRARLRSSRSGHHSATVRWLSRDGAGRRAGPRHAQSARGHGRRVPGHDRARAQRTR